MSSDFTFDTSGSVDHVMAEGCTETGLEFEWSDLDPFTQGYVEAALSCSRGKCLMVLKGGDYDGAKPVAFSDLAPETLALILRDCAEFVNLFGLCETESPETCGAVFWDQRQSGDWTLDPYRSAFPPLTPTLRDDGKVYLREGDHLDPLPREALRQAADRRARQLPGRGARHGPAHRHLPATRGEV